MRVIETEKRTCLEAWLLTGWQALMYYSKQHESAGSLAEMESAAAGTEKR
jgi:hypothetical protein